MLTAAARLPDLFERRVVRLEPGKEHEVDPDDWRDALVVLEAGALELEADAGTRSVVTSGAVLWLDGLGLRAVHNVGRHAAVLVAVSRRRDPPA